ncbi:hypothetical protein BDA99DRAFT_493716 [Phascolomyces articulosus]|uniref:Uncharacterized protein n=1 Tax=Phascolomyces articulosus TaxID=60185 RepID=A0AAD5KD25_9FUNG|nr:hypothetical protein BDA99DRAFT_493716 [Phascolomyces articulosus]
MTSHSSALMTAYRDHVEATTRLIRIALALEWTILTRFIVGVIVATWFSIVYLVWTLRHVQKIDQVWESLNKPVIKLFRPRIFAFLHGNINPFVKSLDIRVSTFSKGFCTAILRNRRYNRDQFKNIHSSAIVLFAQTVGDLALQSILKKNQSATLTTMTMKYKKKYAAHDGSLLTATSDQFQLFMNEEKTTDLSSTDNHNNTTRRVMTIPMQVVIKDYMLDTVAIANFEWEILHTSDA